MPTTPSPPRVLVTGIGLCTSLGNGRESTWEGLREGRSGASWLGVEHALGTPPYAGYPVRHGDRRPSEIFMTATTEAMKDAGLGRETPIDRDRAAVVAGLSKGDLLRLGRSYECVRKGEDGVAGWRAAWPDRLAGAIASAYDLRGPCLAPIAACATGVVAAIRGFDLIRQGVCDLAVIGAGDASLQPLVLGAFRNMKALARVDGDPTTAVRPWDKARSGFLPGEGAAILVLEREDHAKARGAAAYAEFAGGALGSDAHHMTDLNPNPAGLAHVIGVALRNSGVNLSEIDHVNVHGTATRRNDPLECRAIRLAFGPHADSISCSANKPQIGHLLGAAGAAELAITCLAIRDGFVPPTLNLDDPDPQCDLDGTPHAGKSRGLRAAMKLSIGFGGHLAAAVLKRCEGPTRPPVTRTRTPAPHV